MGLFWLAGADLRMTALCLPPLIPLIHRDLRLSESEVGLLGGATPLLLAAFAIPGSLLVARLGPRRALIGGLVVVALAGAARGLGPSVAVLFAMTLVMGIGIALVQPAYPPLAALWFSDRVTFATAVYTNGILAGELAPAALTAPLLVSMLGGSWEWALAAWSLPVLLTAPAVALGTPHVARDAAAPPARWWPDWQRPEVWLLGLIFGCASAVYWGANSFVPDYLHSHHRPDLVAPSLTAINATQFGASFLAALFPRQILGHRWPFIATGLLVGVACLGLLLMPVGAWTVAWTGLLGFASATCFVLTLALTPLLAPGDSHRLTAGVFTISYALAFISPFLSGAVWDLSGRPEAAFAPGLLEAGLIAGLALLLRLPKPEPNKRGDT